MILPPELFLISIIRALHLLSLLNADVTVIGDQTGGGGGLPMSSELPNGWAVRYSSTQTFDSEGNHIEMGIAPDYRVQLNNTIAAQQGLDTMIESAVYYINKRYEEFRITKKWRK